MAFQLKLKQEQSNDATIIRFKDETGEYRPDNLTGWGSINPQTLNVVGFNDSTPGKFHLGLSITIMNSDGLVTSYPDIDIFTQFPNQLTLASGMAYDLSPSHLGLANTQHIDGIWTVKYFIRTSTNVDIAYTIYTYYVDGTVENKVIRDILSSVYNIERGINQENWGDIRRALTKWAYLIGSRSYPSIAKQVKKLNILKTLQNYTIND